MCARRVPLLVVLPLFAAPAWAEDAGEGAAAIEEEAEAAAAPAVEKHGEMTLEPEREGEQIVVVLQLSGKKEDAPLAEALATVLAAEISARDDSRAMSRNELQALLLHNAEQRLLGCESVKCALDIARLAEADLVVSGSLARVEGARLLTLTLSDPRVGAARKRVEVAWRGPAEELALAVRPAVDWLFAGPNAAKLKGALEVFAPEGAEVFVDGKPIGTAPLQGPISDLAIGVHRLEVQKAGFVTAERDVVIARGETTIARVELSAEPYYTQRWFWGAVGGGAAAAVAVGAAFAVMAIAASPPPTKLHITAPLPPGVR